ncbi:RAM signaling pathway protein [Coniochaeta hoffmannii]|uniref:RAM signaling pathway protein n=1 Tax=Coniochaeta hoffmannii TaxID=91930 RepID=A0AA38RLT1_9PEZI|nr:RAM signaling pathway protein [Coniochaeta hoffmannii]
MDRPRGLPENPAQGRRIAAAAAANIPLPPVPSLRDVESNPALLASAPPSSSQVIAMAREAMKVALEEDETQAAGASGVSNELRPGLTINLSHKNIQKLPDEVVDIIKNELERFALSHNNLQSFPARFSECTSLRYLNVRNNKIKEFPLPLCDLKSLEILDLGRNKLRVLPPDIVKLSSLKVLSVQKNQISELPLCLADMVSLQVVKLDGNPLIFPPPEVLQVQAPSPPNEGFLKDSEVTEVSVTAHIKKFLKQKQQAVAMANARSDADTTGDESSEGTETPRLPLKRAMSGRFPIKVPNGSDTSDIRSPAFPRPPPIPTRSHYRGLSQQNTAVRRPGVMPLTIGNVNERLRSNSETLLQASRADRPESRLRRMGVVPKKGSELGTLDETQANNRFSHYRGLSHGSAMQGNGASMATKSPNSPAMEPFLQRPIYVRRLSVLPERRRESKVFDPVLEAAKGILYSVFQIHPTIQMFMSLASDGTDKRSSLEFVLYNTNAHVEELELEIQNHDRMLEEDNYTQRSNENVQRACVTLVNAYAHVCSLLTTHVDLFIDNADPRYIRSLLTQLYNSIMELRVTCTQASRDSSPSRRTPSRASTINDTLRPHSREPSVTPTPTLTRPRNGTFTHNPSNLRVATDVPVPVAFLHGTGRTATINSSATPRSGESFTSSTTSSRGLDFSDEDRLFERIFLSLQRSSELISRTLPSLNAQFAGALRNAIQTRAPEPSLKWWKALVAECSAALAQCETLKHRLSLIVLKEPGIRTQASFWSLCQNFLDSWANLILLFKDAMPNVPLPADIRTRLRPIQQAVKETTNLMVSSPWADYVRQGGASSSHLSPTNGQGLGGATSPFSPSGGSVFAMLPMTPQSAALGPAVQATVPSTPQSANFAAAFNGGVFERADALMASLGGGGHRQGALSNGSYGMRERDEGPRSMVNLDPGMGGMGGGGGGGGGMNGTGTMVPFRINGDARERGKVAF